METVLWLAGIALVIISGLIGVIYYSGQARDNKQDLRTEVNEALARENSKVETGYRERIVKLETKVEMLEEETSKLRNMRHDILDEVTKTNAGWYTEIMNATRELVDRAVRK